jgi:hypothetical protein
VSGTDSNETKPLKMATLRDQSCATLPPPQIVNSCTATEQAFVFFQSDHHGQGEVEILATHGFSGGSSFLFYYNIRTPAYAS